MPVRILDTGDPGPLVPPETAPVATTPAPPPDQSTAPYQSIPTPDRPALADDSTSSPPPSAQPHDVQPQPVNPVTPPPDTSQSDTPADATDESSSDTPAYDSALPQPDGATPTYVPRSLLNAELADLPGPVRPAAPNSLIDIDTLRANVGVVPGYADALANLSAWTNVTVNWTPPASDNSSPPSREGQSAGAAGKPQTTSARSPQARQRHEPTVSPVPPQWRTTAGRITYAIDYLHERLPRLTAVQLAALIGNMAYESRPIRRNPPLLLPTAIQNQSRTLPYVNPPPPKEGVGVGIAQWTTKTRQDALLELAKKEGRPYTDFNVQLDEVVRELADPKHQDLLVRPRTLQDLERVNGAGSAALAKATQIVREGFEGPGIVNERPALTLPCWFST